MKERRKRSLVDKALDTIVAIRKYHGITLSDISKETKLTIPAISQHLSRARGYPDAEAMLLYLRFIEGRRPGIVSKMLR